VVWFEEGNGAALLDGDGILAIIPSWSGMGGFDGYSRQCVGEGPTAWALPEDPTIHERVRSAQEYWQLWDDESFWESYRDRLLAPLEALLGAHCKYYAIDGGNWPPRALVRFDLPQSYVLVTIGMSLLPMPRVEMEADDPSPYRRTELGAVIDRRVPEAEVSRFGSYLSRQAGYPWQSWSWLGHGHTVPCNSTPPTCGGTKLPFALLSAQMAGAPQVEWPDFRGDHINLLWVTPISAKERELATQKGSDALRAQFARAGRTTLISPRA
jgi:hypothetical protein